MSKTTEKATVDKKKTVNAVSTKPSVLSSNVKKVLAPKIKRYLELKEEIAPLEKELKYLKSELNQVLVNIPSEKIGDYLYTGNRMFRDGYEVSPTDWWQISFQKI